MSKFQIFYISKYSIGKNPYDDSYLNYSTLNQNLSNKFQSAQYAIHQSEWNNSNTTTSANSKQSKNSNNFSVSPTRSNVMRDSSLPNYTSTNLIANTSNAPSQANKLTKQKSSGNLNVNGLVTSLVNNLQQCQQ